MNIKAVTFNERHEDAFIVRRAVFVDEQNISEEIEIDDLEEEAVHFIGYVNGHPVAASRLRFVDDMGKLERICVLKEFRKYSYGSQIIQAMEKMIKDNDVKKAVLNAQTTVIPFYEKHGYKVVSDEFFDAGIPHVKMMKNLIK